MDYEDFLAKVEKMEDKPTAEPSDWTPHTGPYGFHIRHGVLNIRRGYCQAVLNGDNSGLMLSFSWTSTPQGPHYWSSRRWGDVPMSVEDYEFIRSLIA